MDDKRIRQHYHTGPNDGGRIDRSGGDTGGPTTGGTTVSVTAADVPIVDAGAYFTGTDVEAALQEIGAGQDQWKQPCRCATTASVTISTALNAGDTIDTVTLAAGDRVLVKNQGTASENGIYIAGATPARAADMDDDLEVLGAVVQVIAGSQAGTTWRCTNTAATIVDTDAIDWATSATLADPMTTRGDVIVRNASNVTARLGIGAAGKILTSDGTDVAWGNGPMTTQDDIIVGGTSGAPARLAKGTDGQVLTVDPTTHHLVWATPSAGSGDVATDTIWDAAGDLAVGTGADTAARLAIGTSGHVLTSNGTTAGWAAPAGGSGGFPLDSYTIDATYGMHFTGASLPAALTRRNFTSGAETYQVGKDATYLRVSQASRTNGDLYLQTAPAGDWTIALAFVGRNFNGVLPNWGLWVVDSSGNGVCCQFYHTPYQFNLLGVNTYTTYNSTSSRYGGSQALGNDWIPMGQAKRWYSLRKSGTNYYGAFSFDGEAWGPETSALSWAGTVDRFGMGVGVLGSLDTANPGMVDVDWFNKIA